MIRHYQVYVLYMKCTSGEINVQEVYIYFDMGGLLKDNPQVHCQHCEGAFPI